MKHFLRIISITLLLAMMLSCVASCGLLDGVNTDTGSSDISSIVESILTGAGSSSDSGWLYPDDELETDPDNPTIPPILFPDEEEDTGTKPPILVPDEDTGSGDDNTGSGDDNTGSGDDNTGSGDNNTGSGDDNTGSGDNNTGSGDDNTGSGDNNTGSGDDNTGSGDDNTGSGDDNTGSGDNNTGSGDDNTGSGDNNTGSGDDNTGSGDDNTGSGDNNTGSGDDNTGSGDDNTGSGDNNTGSGDDNTGSGDDNTGSGDNNTGSGDDNTGTGDDNTDDSEDSSILIDTVGVSYDPYDYIGDVEAFVYGMLINELEALYHIYPGYVQLSNLDVVYGLIYTNFQEQTYDEENPDTIYISSGFLPFPKEPVVAEDEFDTGLLIYNLEYDEDESIFVWDYKSDAFADHCVVFDLYLIYGVDENGCIFYQARDYVRGYCDETLGNLYSYDEGREVFVNEVEEYIPITASSIAELVDFEALEDEINANLDEQAKAFASFNIETAAYEAQEGVYDYLLSLQEETVLGVPLPDLLEAVKDLDPTSVFRITDEGLKVIDITDPPPPQASNTSKWIVGIACGIIAIGAMVGEQFAMAIPGLPALTGAVSATAIEIFMQVVIEGTAISHLDWRKVVVSAAVGAVSGLAGQITFGIVNNNMKNLTEFGKIAARIAIEAGIDTVLGTVEQTIIAAIEGQRGIELLKTAGLSALISAGLSIGLNVVGEAITAGIGKIITKVTAKKAVAKAAKTVATKSKRVVKEVGENAANTAKKTTNCIADFVEKHFKKVDDCGSRYAKWLSNARTAKKIAENSTEKFQKELAKQTDKLIKKLTKNNKLDDELLEGIVDAAGKKMTAKQVKELAENAAEGQIIAIVKVSSKKNGSVMDFVIPVTKTNGVLSCIPQNVPNFHLDAGLVKKTGNKLNYDSTVIAGTTEYLNKLKKGDMPIPDWVESIVKTNYADQTVKEALDGLDGTGFRQMLESAQALPSFDEVTGRMIFYPDKFTKDTIRGILDNPPNDLRSRMVKTFFKSQQKVLDELGENAQSEDELARRLINAANGEVVGIIEQVIDGEVVRIPIKAINSLPDVDFSSFGMRLPIKGGLGTTREYNFKLGAKALKEYAVNNGVLEADFVSELLERFPQYKTAKEALEALDEDAIVDFVAGTSTTKASKYVFHESLDGNIYLIRRSVHSVGYGYKGVAHPGWISVVKQLKVHSGSRFIGEMQDAALNGATYIADSLNLAS